MMFLFSLERGLGMPGHPTLGFDCEEVEDLLWTSLDSDHHTAEVQAALGGNGSNQWQLENEYTGSLASDHIPLKHLVLVELLLHMSQLAVLQELLVELA